ncbi:hypothetical protein Tco_1151403 [Tanacetum coccineum]
MMKIMTLLTQQQDFSPNVPDIMKQFNDLKIGCVYWVVLEGTPVDSDRSCSFDYMIMSFDLITREIKVVDIPRSCITNNSFSGCYYISKLLESLILLVSNKEVDIPVYHVWKMEHNGSLTKLFTINTPGLTINNILGFRKNGELVMEIQKEDQAFAALEIYDPYNMWF